MSRSSLLDAIEFTFLISQLNPHNLNKFISRLSQDVIIRSLFCFINSKLDEDASKLIKTTVSDIIQSKKDNESFGSESQSTHSNINRLDKISKSVSVILHHF